MLAYLDWALRLISDPSDEFSQDEVVPGCAPAWARHSQPCPHGHRLWILEATVPNQIGFDTVIALIYLAVPYTLFALVLVNLARKRGPREAGWVFFVLWSALTAGVAKQIIREPRPAASCLASCGSPSSHSTSVVGMLGVFVWDNALKVPELDPLFRNARALAASAVVLPHLWAKVALGDAAVGQVFAGLVLGLLLATLWVSCLRPPTEWFLMRWVCGEQDETPREPQDDMELAVLSRYGRNLDRVPEEAELEVENWRPPEEEAGSGDAEEAAPPRRSSAQLSASLAAPPPSLSANLSEGTRRLSERTRRLSSDFSEYAEESSCRSAAPPPEAPSLPAPRGLEVSSPTSVLDTSAAPAVEAGGKGCD